MDRRTVIGIGLALCVGAGAATFVAMRVQPGRQSDGTYLVETGQTLTPLGRMVTTEFARPKDVAVSPDGSMVAVLATNGVHLYGLDGSDKGSVRFGGGSLGLAWAPGGLRIFASGSNGDVVVIDRGEKGWTSKNWRIDLEGKSGNPQANGLAVSSDGTKLYVALGIRNAVVEVDAQTGKVLRSTAVDAAPYHLLLANGALYVACRGGIEASEFSTAAESTAGTQVRVDPRTDAVGLGTVVRVDLGDLSTERVVNGRQPGAMAWANGGLYVAMADSDTVAFVKDGHTEYAKIRPPDDANFGQIPTGLAFGGGGRTMYVSLGGANAVAVCDTSDGIAVKGYFPTAWFPIGVATTGDSVVVPCAKGIGSRAESTNANDATGRGIKFQQGLYYIHNNMGTVQFVGTGDFANLQAQTRKVASNNSWGRELPARNGVAPVPVPERVGEPSVFKHVVYIIKENLSYDAILGDMREGNGRSDLCMFPEMVSPNHHEIARDFVLLDNTYVSGTNSADGHQWTDSAVANEYMERSYNAYARSYPYDGGDPLAFSPEGFLWNAAVESGLKVRVFGEFVDKPVVRNRETGKGGSFKDVWEDYKSGTNKFEIKAGTSQKALEPLLNPNYIGFPQNVSDQWRADQFLGELAAWEKSGEMPQLCILLLPNDHTVGFTPDYPTPWAAVADNDLALGRIVEGLSKSQFWKDTLVLGLEDDCQLGIDHVDGHRTFAFVASPYTKRGAVVSQMYTTTSFVRTIGLVLGLPAMTRFDRTAHPLSECFVSKPDFAPYEHRPNRVPLDELTPRPEQLSGEARRLALESMKQDWSQVDRANPEVVTRAAWLYSHPSEPFPAEYFNPSPDGH